MNLPTSQNPPAFLAWMTGKDGVETYFSKDWLDFRGRTLDQELGGGWLEGVHPEDLERCLEEGRAALAAHRELAVDFRFRRQDGSYRWMRKQGAPRFTGGGDFLGHVGSCLDITEQLEAEQALKGSEERYRSLFRNMLQGCVYGEVMFLGEEVGDFHFLDVNEPFEVLTGWRGAIGRRASEVVPDLRESCSDLLAILGRVAGTGASERAEIRLGDLGVWVALEVFSLQAGQFVAMFEDITYRKWEELLGRESVALAAKAQLSAYVAHEINGPLAGIKSAFTLLGTAVAGDHMYRPYVDLVSREIDRIGDTVRMMYELHRPKDSRAQNTSVATLLQDIATVLGPKLSKHKVTLELEVAEPGLRAVLPADLLRQVIFNLVHNAVDATPPKGVVGCRVYRDGDILEVQVRDQGIGIPPELVERVWVPGFTTKRTMFQGGLGLGLSTSKRLLECMRGSIHFENDPGGGCVFYVRIPLEWKDMG